MKKIVAFSFLILFASSIQAQNWQWAKSIHSNSYDVISSQCYDAVGNIYLTGYFTGTNCFFENDTLQQSSLGTIYIAKYSSIGNEIWVKVLTSQTSSICGGGRLSLKYDTISNTIIICGSFCNSITFNNITYTSTNQTKDGIIAKIDLNGNSIWAQKIVGNGDDFITGAGYDENDNIYICGINYSAAQIDSITVSQGTFIAKYDNNGSFKWAKHISGQGNFPNSIAYNPVDLKVKNSNFYIAGPTESDTLLIDTFSFARPNAYGTAVVKFDLNGNSQWAKVSGYTQSGSSAYSFAIDNLENTYLISSFADSVLFDNLSLFTNQGSLSDLAFAKFDKNGNFKWVKQITCSGGGAIGYDVAIGVNNILYTTGKFRGNMQLNNYIVTSKIGPPSQNNFDAFLAAFDTLGECLGVEHFGYAEGLTLIVDNANNPILSGKFYNTINIGSNTLTVNGSNGDPDAFIAKHVPITGITTLSKTSNNQLFIHANPNTGKCNITLPADVMNEVNLVLSIYNNQGSLIQKIAVNTSEQKIKINLEAEAAGIYTAVLSGGGKSYSGKIVFE